MLNKNLGSVIYNLKISKNIFFFSKNLIKNIIKIWEDLFLIYIREGDKLKNM